MTQNWETYIWLKITEKSICDVDIDRNTRMCNYKPFKSIFIQLEWLLILAIIFVGISSFEILLEKWIVENITWLSFMSYDWIMLFSSI